MREVNPNKIKRAEIVVGIPSYNEADTISNVVRQVDAGLEKYFRNRKKVIINTDNNSPDKTGKVFLGTKTKTPKIYISTSPGIRGKGNNFHNLFLKIKNLGAEAATSIDADIKSITAEWVKCLLEPITAGYDYVSPLYLRDKNDGTITNHICYPLAYGLLGYNIRQPIGGDVGFSKRLVEYWLNQKWTEPVRNYGIDIFMTLNTIKGGFKLGQANLGSKIHKPSAPKLGNMFLEVIDTLFKFLSENKNLWQKEINLRTLPLICDAKNKAAYQQLSIDNEVIEEKAISEFQENYKYIKKYISQELRSQLEEMFLRKKSLKITLDLWPKIVYQLFYLYDINSSNTSIIKFLRALYFGRIVSFIKETSGKTQEESEKIIQKQALYFFEKRNYLLSLS